MFHVTGFLVSEEEVSGAVLKAVRVAVGSGESPTESQEED